MDSEDLMESFQVDERTLLIHVPNEEEALARKLGQAALVSNALETKLKQLASRAISAKQSRSWSEAVFGYEKFLKVVRREGQGLSNQLRVWLITWASVEVAHLRHLRFPSHGIAIDIYDHLLFCLESSDNRHSSFANVVKDLRRMVLFDWGRHIIVGPRQLFGVQMEDFNVVCLRHGEHFNREDPTLIDISRLLALQHQACGQYDKALAWAGVSRKLLEYFFERCAALRQAGSDLDFTAVYETFFLDKLVDCRVIQADLLSRIGDYEQGKKDLLDLKDELDAMVDTEESLELSQRKLNSAIRHVNTALVSIYLQLPDDAEVRSAIESLDTECRDLLEIVPPAENDEASYIAQQIHRSDEYRKSTRVQEAIECLQAAFLKIKGSSDHSIRRRYGLDSANLLAVMFEDASKSDDAVECLQTACKYRKEACYFASERGNLYEIADACFKLGRILSCLLEHRVDKQDKSLIPVQVATWLKDAPKMSAPALLLQDELDWLSAWISAASFYRLSASLYSEVLYNIRDRSTSWMKVMNHSQHRQQYLSLQVMMGIMLKHLDEVIHRDLVGEISKMGLLWAERGRTRTLVYQLGPGWLYNLAPTATMGEYLEFDLQDQVAWIALREGQSACGAGAVFIEYTLSKTAIIAYAVTKDGNASMHIVPTPGKEGEPLEQLLDTLMAAMSNEKDYHEPQVLRQLEVLYALFLGPFANVLADMEVADKLVFCPHEEIARVPFALLRNPETKRFLFEEHTVSLTPSLRVLYSCHGRHSYLRSLGTDSVSGKLAVAIGDPAYERKRIEKTLLEVKALESLFGDQCASLTGTDATVERFLQLVEQPSLGATTPYHGVIHLAVHGHVNSSFKQGALQFAAPQPASEDGQQKNFGGPIRPATAQPQDGTSTLAPPVSVDAYGHNGFHRGPIEGETSQLQDGTFAEVGHLVRRGRGGTYAKKTYLRSEDITNCGFDWRAFMVVLSACNTSQGEVLAEGILNMPRALTTVGVPCTVMSQWKCVDESTAELMVQFYGNMKAGDDAATALRRSMLLLLDNKRKEEILEIYRWGAFILWGLPTVRLPAAMLHENVDS